ncbi:hypothetical protein LTR17_023014 [Elasticomyces elasticus]|nr:hypothetical protein LTR17_023014 [Elasticomyces elasticus]
MGFVNYKANDGSHREDIRPDLYTPGQMRLCDSQNNPACWFGRLSKSLKSPTPQNALPGYQDVTAAEAELAETPQAASVVNVSSRTSKRTAEGGIIRPKSRRLPHNLIERRYRDNLNHQIEVLRDELPTFKSIVACTGDIETTISLGAKWPSKAVVIVAAVQYIALLEQERGQVNARNTLLCEQVEGLQKLVRCDDCSIVKYLAGMQPFMVSG